MYKNGKKETCLTCGQSNDSKKGPHCKACRRAKYKTNPEPERARSRKWAATHPRRQWPICTKCGKPNDQPSQFACKSCRNAYLAAQPCPTCGKNGDKYVGQIYCRPCALKKKHAEYWRDPASAIAAVQRRRAAKPDLYADIEFRAQRKAGPKRALAARAWRQANPERVKAAHEAWGNSPEGRAASRQYAQERKHALRAGADPMSWKLLPRVHAQWLKAFGGKCVYCGTVVKLGKDHLNPVDQSGPHALYNLVPACSSCNSKKHNRTPEQAGMTANFDGCDFSLLTSKLPTKKLRYSPFKLKGAHWWSGRWL